MITKTWKIDQTVVKTTEQFTNVVTNVIWRIDGILETETGEIYTTQYKSSTGLAEPTGEFVSFELLTEAQVLQWVKDSLGPDAVALAESQIDSQFDVVINLPAPTPTAEEFISPPWVN